MKRFFEDNSRSIEEINAAYAGKSMAEIHKAEEARRDSIKEEIDIEHTSFVKNGREKMLTVQKLIDYLKTQDPNACILAYEDNSFAYIEQWPDLPNQDICTVAETKKDMRESLKQWYKGTENADEKIEKEIADTFRYAKDNDIVIKFC